MPLDWCLLIHLHVLSWSNSPKSLEQCISNGKKKKHFTLECIFYFFLDKKLIYSLDDNVDDYIQSMIRIKLKN